MKYYIIAGEASGDLHGSNLIRAILKEDQHAEVRCWGGDMMEAAGAVLVKHYRDLAFMGFVEVLKNLRTIFKNLKACKQDILQYQPDVIILIDYPGFNLRIAAWGKKAGFKIVYYIAPQVWAWKENRVKSMRKYIDKLLVILPFEKDYFQNKWNWEVEYVGHPLVEVVDKFNNNPTPLQLNYPPSDPANKGFIALLPGSRKQEISKKLPVMLEVSKAFPHYTFVVAKAPGMEDAFYHNFISAYKNVTTVQAQTYALLHSSQAALVTSGTATLETALFGVPEVVCYKGSPISYVIAKRVIKVKYISLVNLIMDRALVKELIQDEMTVANCSAELKRLLTDAGAREQLDADYKALKNLLQKGGNASSKAAASIHALLQ